MALAKIGTSRDTLCARSTANPDSPWVTWTLPPTHWVEQPDLGTITLPPGRYRVEPVGGTARHWPDTGDAQDYTGVFYAEDGQLRAYASRNPATEVFITRLA